uniref:Uncharacterized protein n=1 Tax=Anguilla anguilla TaxID=7936 RepID=A0A0E9THJ0_ANGAN
MSLSVAEPTNHRSPKK